MTTASLDIALVRELMTLAGLAYGDPQSLDGYMSDGQSGPDGWSLIWAAHSDPVPTVFAFIARHEASNRSAIVIRGTYPNPLNVAYWNDATLDSPYGPMQPWPGDATGKAKISQGTSTALQDLLQQQGTVGTFSEAVAVLPVGELYITGHSLGGTLAPVVGLWLSERATPVVATAICAFAGMTPGNADFAVRFGHGSKLAGRVWRYNNTLDTVPYGWDRVWSAINFYQPKPSGGLLVKIVIFIMGLILKFYGFSAIGTEVRLVGKLNEPVLQNMLLSYVIENLRQHLPQTYLDLLEGPTLPFTMGYGAIVSAPTDPSVAHMWTKRPRAFYM